MLTRVAPLAQVNPAPASSTEAVTAQGYRVLDQAWSGPTPGTSGPSTSPATAGTPGSWAAPRSTSGPRIRAPGCGWCATRRGPPEQSGPAAGLRPGPPGHLWLAGLGSGLAVLIALVVDPVAVYPMLAILALGWVYSAPPFRLRRFLALGHLVLAGIGMGSYLLGATLVHGNLAFRQCDRPLLGLIGALFFTGSQFKDLKDTAGDREAGVTTLATGWASAGPTGPRAAWSWPWPPAGCWPASCRRPPGPGRPWGSSNCPG